MAKQAELFVAKEIRYVKTHRGINAYANIYKGAQKVGTVEDIAECIVAPVFFNTPALQAEFLVVAKKKIPAPYAPGEPFLISEYARLLITHAEDGK